MQLEDYSNKAAQSEDSQGSSRRSQSLEVDSWLKTFRKSRWPQIVDSFLPRYWTKIPALFLFWFLSACLFSTWENYWFIAQAGSPVVRIIQREKTIRNLLLTKAEFFNDTISALGGIQISCNSLAWVVMDKRIFLGFLLASHGGICAIAKILAVLRSIKNPR